MARTGIRADALSSVGGDEAGAKPNRTLIEKDGERDRKPCEFCATLIDKVVLMVNQRMKQLLQTAVYSSVILGRMTAGPTYTRTGIATPEVPRRQSISERRATNHR